MGFNKGSFKKGQNSWNGKMKASLNKNLDNSKVLQDFWTIENVNYRNKICKVNLLKTLLDNRNRKNQDSWAEFSKQAKENNGFYLGDMPLYHSIFTKLYELKDKPKSNKIRDFLKEQFLKRGLMTLTRINYQPNGCLDKIVHNYKMPDEYLIEGNFSGLDEDVEYFKNKRNYKSLLDSNNPEEINFVYNWITGKNARLFRVNSKPEQEDKRIAWFGVKFNWIYLNCCRSPFIALSGLGVRVVEEK